LNADTTKRRNVDTPERHWLGVDPKHNGSTDDGGMGNGHDPPVLSFEHIEPT
jgi:hypothetical protein